MMFSKSIFVHTAVAAWVSMAQAAEWGTDYEAALVQAASQGKAVLADFTGSDWCGYCMRLRAEVLDNPSFAEWAEKNFVLLEIDVPHNPKFDRKLLEKNQALCAKYGIDGYPTVLVLDAKGRALGGLFGYESDPVLVRRILEPGLQAAQLLKTAESLEGVAKLEALLTAWRLLPEELHALNKELQAEIMSIDSEDRSGLKALADAERRFLACKHASEVAPTDAVAMEIIDAALFEAVPQNKRQLLELKYKLMLHMAQTQEDVLAAADVGYMMIDADLRISPQVKENMKAQLRGVFANPQTSLNRSRMIRRKRPIR